MSLDNRSSQKSTSEQVTILRTLETYGEFHCIICLDKFQKYAGPLGLQTLFCDSCFNHLQNSINREKTQNYGW